MFSVTRPRLSELCAFPFYSFKSAHFSFIFDIFDNYNFLNKNFSY